MQRRMKFIVGAAALATAGALGTGIALAGGGDDEATERPINGKARARAEAAALEYTDGGRVTGTEEGDEESLYEVEVTKAGGRQVDVQLDKNFKVVGREADDDESGDDESDDD